MKSNLNEFNRVTGVTLTWWRDVYNYSKTDQVKVGNRNKLPYSISILKRKLALEKLKLPIN